MSTTIDQKVVEMRFDNRQFESNVSTTMSTLDKLKHSLKFTGATKGLEELDAASRKLDFSEIENTACRAGFSLRDVWLKTSQVFEYQIARRIINAGERIAKALTIEPVMTGFKEYETQINAIQTILANTESKGTTLDDVNGALDELNAYADKTIYNFTEMTRNIGTFTAAGTDLETSVSAIKGIANLAAVSGSTSQQASTAMYQLSQAMASGTVKLMDWNSVVNAGMGGQVFQDALKETAKVHGVAIDEIIEKNGSFRESLSEGWLTTEILTDTLSKFTMAAEEGSEEWEAYKKSLKEQGYTDEQAEKILKMANTATDAATKVKTFTQLWDTLKEAAQSGWTQTWEIIVGDFEESKELLTKISDVVGNFINEMSEARNSVLKDWKALGGRDDLLASFSNIFQGLLSVIEPIKEAFTDMFPPITGKQIADLCAQFKEFTEDLRLTDDASENIKRTFKGVFALIKIGGKILSAAFTIAKPILGFLIDVIGAAFSLTGILGDFIVGIDDAAAKTNIFNAVASKIAVALSFVFRIVKSLASVIGNVFIIGPIKTFTSFLDGFRDKLYETGTDADKLGSAISAAFESAGAALENSALFKTIKAISTVITSISKALGKVVGTMVGGLVDRLANADFEGLMTFIANLSLGVLVGYVVKFVKNLSGLLDTVTSFKDGLLDIVGGVTDVLDSVRESLETWQNSIKIESLLKIAKAMLILVASIVVLALIPQDRLNKSLAALSVLFLELVVGLKAIGKVGSLDINITKTSAVIVALSLAVLILAAALKKISDLSIGELATGLLGVAALTTILVIAVKMISAISKNKQVMKGALQIVLLAAAIKILASVCKDLSSLSLEELAKGVGSVVVMTLALAAAAKLMTNTSGKSVKAIGQTILIALSLVLLGHALESISTLSWEEIFKGLTGLLGAIAILVAASFVMSKFTSSPKGAFSMIVMAGALCILAYDLKQLASLSWDKIWRSLTSMGIALTLLVAATFVLSKINGLSAIAGAAAMLLVTASIASLVPSLVVLGGLSWDAITKGLVSLTVVLVLFAAVIALMAALNAKAVIGAAAIVIMAVALQMMVPVIKSLGSMSWDEITKGLVAIAGAFAILAAAALVMSPIIVVVIALAAAIALIGIGVLAAGAGLTSFSIGLMALAGAIVVVAKALPALVSVIDGIIVAVFTALANGIVAFCNVIIQGAPAIGGAIKTLVLEVVDVIVTCAPAIVNGILELISLLLAGISQYIPEIVKLLFDILIGVINSIGENIGPLIKAAADVLMAFIAGVIEAIAGMDKSYIKDLFLSVGMLTAIMAGLAAMAILTPAAMVGVVGMGVVVSELAIVLAAIGALAQIPGLQWLMSEGGDFLQVVGTAIGKFIGGITGGFMSGVSAQFAQIGTDLSNFMTNVQPFIDGASKIDPSILKGVAALTGAILLITASSFIESITSWLTGDSSITKFAEELPKLGEGLKGFSDAIDGVKPENITAAANAAKVLAEMTNTIPNEGGVVGWFAGENSIAAFGDALPKLGEGLKTFSDSVEGLSPENITAASNAAKTLAEMCNTIPNEGGVVGWFGGENSIAVWGANLPILGKGLKDFSDSVEGLNAENVGVAASAAKKLAEMAATIPNEGGVVAWFAGENSMSSFADALPKLGEGLMGFSAAVEGLNTENVTAASSAAKTLAEMTEHIPSEGGIKAWFAGDTSIAGFGSNIVKLGEGLRGFSDKVADVNPESVTAAADAAKSLAQMTEHIPSEGGIKAWFAGESSISTFADKLPKLGEGLKGFSDNVNGINPENITAAVKAAKNLAQMAETTPPDLGPMVNFGNKLKPFGEKLKGYFDQTAKITEESITASKNAISAVKKVNGIKVGDIETASKAIAKLAETLRGVSGIKSSTTDGFVKAINRLGSISVDNFIKAFDGINKKMTDIGKKAVDAFIKSVSSKEQDVIDAGADMADAFADGASGNKKASLTFADLVKSMISSARDKRGSMESAGSYLVSGLASGISAKAPAALSAARALANSVSSAIRAALRIKSPSKEGYEIGDYFGIGFVNAIGDYERVAYNASYSVGDSAKTGLGNAIAKIQRFLDNDMVTQPVIRPVLDLSDVRSEAGNISGMFNGESMSIMSNVGAISSMMAHNGQNGANAEVVSAIDKLRKELGNVKSETYQINGVTYDDGSNIAEAVQSIIRAARIERRV